MGVAVRKQLNTHTHRKLLGVWSTWEHGKFEHIAHMLVQERNQLASHILPPCCYGSHYSPLNLLSVRCNEWCLALRRLETSDWVVTCTCCANPQHTPLCVCPCLCTILTPFVTYCISVPLTYEKWLLRLPLWQREVLTGCRGNGRRDWFSWWFH